MSIGPDDCSDIYELKLWERPLWDKMRALVSLTENEIHEQYCLEGTSFRFLTGNFRCNNPTMLQGHEKSLSPIKLFVTTHPILQ